MAWLTRRFVDSVTLMGLAVALVSFLPTSIAPWQSWAGFFSIGALFISGLVVAFTGVKEE